MNVTLGQPLYLLLLLLVPLLGVLLFAFLRWRKESREAYAEPRFRKHLFAKNSGISRVLPLFYLLAVTFLVLSIVDVLGASEKIKSEQKMNNVLFLLDVSSSMNAEDIEPSRLTMAKNILIATLQGLENDRVGIIVFAAEGRSILPLTTDFTAVESYVKGIETTILQRQGTDFLKPIEEAVKKFKSVPKGSRQIVLISDGEDNEEKQKAALALAKKEGIRILSVGVGTSEGAPVPEYLYGQLLGYKMGPNGQPVVTKREEKALIALAEGTGGSYVNGNSLENAYREILHDLRNAASDSNLYVDSQNAAHYYQYFLAVSLFFFLLILLFNPKRGFHF